MEQAIDVCNQQSRRGGHCLQPALMGRTLRMRIVGTAILESLHGTQGCAIRGQRCIIHAMQELLSKADDSTIPLPKQEFFELSLFDTANELGTRYCVRQAHAEWSEIDGQIMWDQEELDYFWILNEAKQRYAERRVALTQKGFIYSDMDL